MPWFVGGVVKRKHVALCCVNVPWQHLLTSLKTAL